MTFRRWRFTASIWAGKPKHTDLRAIVRIEPPFAGLGSVGSKSLPLSVLQRAVLGAVLGTSVGACAARRAAPVAPNEVVAMEGMRIVARQGGHGGYEFDAYDAEGLFNRGNALLDQGDCSAAVAAYDRLVSEFAGSRYESPALYNAGLCLAQTEQLEQALARFTRILDTLPESSDVKHATFQAGHLLVELEKWETALARADQLLSREDLDAPERMEALTIRAQGLLGKADLSRAEEKARQALSYYRTRAEELSADPFFAAAANFVVAECIRRRGEAMVFPDGDQDAQKAVLVKRAQLLLDAMREYANTISHTSAIRETNPKWAAAAGYQIGAMYDTLWHDLMAAPVPPGLSAGARELYPGELAKLIKPLLRHAIRYWELTLMMAERTGGQGEWVERTREKLEKTRSLLLEQPLTQATLAASSSAHASPGEAQPEEPEASADDDRSEPQPAAAPAEPQGPASDRAEATQGAPKSPPNVPIAEPASEPPEQSRANP